MLGYFVKCFYIQCEHVSLSISSKQQACLIKKYLNCALKPRKTKFYRLLKIHIPSKSVDLKAWWFFRYRMFGKQIAYLRQQHISNSNCVKQPLLVNKKMKTASCAFILFIVSLFPPQGKCVVDINLKKLGDPLFFPGWGILTVLKRRNGGELG